MTIGGIFQTFGKIQDIFWVLRYDKRCLYPCKGGSQEYGIGMVCAVGAPLVLITHYWAVNMMRELVGGKVAMDS